LQQAEEQKAYHPSQIDLHLIIEAMAVRGNGMDNLNINDDLMKEEP